MILEECGKDDDIAVFDTTAIKIPFINYFKERMLSLTMGQVFQGIEELGTRDPTYLLR